MGKSHGKQTFATTKEINSCVNQNQTSRFESVEIKTLHKIKKRRNTKNQRSIFQSAKNQKNQKGSLFKHQNQRKIKTSKFKQNDELSSQKVEHA